MLILYSRLLLISIIPLLYISVYFKDRTAPPKLIISKEESSFTFNKDLLYYFSMGNRRLISSFLWSYTLLESDTEHYKKRDGNSWMFNRFNTIARLDPKFYENYLFGGQYLSIIKDDVRGAEIIYNHGIKEFPDDYFLNFNAGFNYFFELKNSKKALVLFKKVQYMQLTKTAAPYLPSLVAKISAKEESIESAFLLLETSYKLTKIKRLKIEYKRSLYAIRAEIDLKCLNLTKTNCNKNDYYNFPYILINGLYEAKLKWKKFEVAKSVRNL